MQDDPKRNSRRTVEYRFPRPKEQMEFSGERYVTGLIGPIQYEHYHRYLLAASFCADRSILDIACGEGYGSDLLSQVGRSVVRVDISPEAIDFARSNYCKENLEFLVGSSASIPLPTSSVEVVVSFETLEHFADHEGFLAEVYRVLSPGGLFIISSPNRESYGPQNANPFHKRELDREEFRSTLGTRFSNVAIFEQRSIDGSAIAGEPGNCYDTESFENVDSLKYHHVDGIPGPQFFVAFATNSKLPKLSNSLFFSGGYWTYLQQRIEVLESEVKSKELEVATLVAENAALREQREGAQYRSRGISEFKIGVGSWKLVNTIISRWNDWRVKRAFDRQFYLTKYPDVADAGIDPLEHFLGTGWRERRDPNSYFSTSFYFETYPEVRKAGINPFIHYVTTGRRRGFRPNRNARPDGHELVMDQTDFVPLNPTSPLADKPVRVLAFYLPQFHTIVENDLWWGEGFTEWTNVRAAVPQFEGHYQPHKPGELGYYDLLDPGVQARQIELAKLFGVEGFCFYFYWFAGKRLLERPLENWLNDKSLDLPFCLCWANENWTRRWDGQDNEILIEQHHSPEDDIEFIKAVAPYLLDERYVRVDGKPLLIVYRPNLLPNMKETAARWRDWCRRNGVGELHLAYTQSFEDVDPAIYGLDAAIEFPPVLPKVPRVRHGVRAIVRDFGMNLFDWRGFKERSDHYGDPGYRLYRGLCTNWDNTARRKRAGTIFANSSPELFRLWLINAIDDTLNRFSDWSERLVFVNAWNEWGEGAHLEPDQRYGYAWLQAIRDALQRVADERRPRRVIIVSHDAHPHGAQFLALHMAQSMRELGLGVDTLLLGDGILTARFAEHGTVHSINIQTTPPADVARLLDSLAARGASHAFVNTAVSGALVPALKDAGISTTALVHELPRVLESYGLQEQSRFISTLCEKVVFAAPQVREGFERYVGREVANSVIRPQGHYDRSSISDEARSHIRAEIRERHNLPPSAQIILAVGYGDQRKGLDLFVESCIGVIQLNRNAFAVWVGHFDQILMRLVKSRVAEVGLSEHFIFTGFLDKPSDYHAAADVYALTSREDPFPSVVLASLEAQVPVVAFDGAGGIGELLSRGCGVLVPSEDCQAMTSALVQILEDPREAEQLGACGKRIIDEEFVFRDYVFDLLTIAGYCFPKISVIVPNFNYSRFLSGRLESIARQTLAPYEILVLDDASTDDSLRVIHEFKSNCAIPMRIVSNSTNSGSVFKQWRRGVDLAKGDLVWIAEADDLCASNMLEKLATAFSRPDVVMSYCQSKQIDESGSILSDDYLDYVADIDRNRWKSSFIANGRDEITGYLYVKNTIPNVSAVLFRRQILQDVIAEFREEIDTFKFAGDWVTYLRILERGALSFASDSLNFHRRHANGVTLSSHAVELLREIVRVQQDTNRRYHLGPLAQEKSDRYAQSLFEQFGLKSGQFQRFSEHPALFPLADSEH